MKYHEIIMDLFTAHLLPAILKAKIIQWLSCSVSSLESLGLPYEGGLQTGPQGYTAKHHTGQHGTVCLEDHWKEPSPTHPGETLQPGPFVKHVVSELFVGVSVEPLSKFCVVKPRVESLECRNLWVPLIF